MTRLIEAACLSGIDPTKNRFYTKAMAAELGEHFTFLKDPDDPQEVPGHVLCRPGK